MLSCCEELHGLDKRQLSSWCVLASPSPADSAYRRSAFARGKVQNLELVRPRDMVIYVDVDPEGLPDDIMQTDRQRTLSAADRQRQRGVAACSAILKSILTGLSLPADGAVLVVEWHAGVAAEWTRAVRMLQNEQLSGGTSREGPEQQLPSKIWSVGFADTTEQEVFLTTQLRQECYKDWFDNKLCLPDIGRVGPKVLPADQYPPEVPQPELKVGYYGVGDNNQDVLVLPESVDRKFEGNTELSQRWKVFKEAHVQRFGVAKTVPDRRPAHSHTASANNPDFSYRGPAPSPAPQVSQDTMKRAADIEASRVFTYKLPLVRTSKTIPMHVCKGDAERFELWADGTECENDVKLIALETILMGFGLGKWTAGAAAAPEKSIAFKLTNDTAYLTVKGNDGSKKTARVCEHLEDLRLAGQEGKLAYHSVLPLTNTNTSRPVHGRYELQTIKETYYQPKVVDISTRLGEGKPITAAEAGACYANTQVGNLPIQMAAVIFECTVVPGASGTDSTIRPSQPKLVLVQEVTVPKGHCIKIL
jgi:hypothetical protein